MTGRVEDVLDSSGRPDLVVTNPPRTGMDAAGDARRSSGRRPERIVYISCDPGDAGARPHAAAGLPARRAVAAFDLFPQTAHVETVAVLERAS